ncbi:MAG TPA: bifunctional homocysteine S-methyltransferase/methylenetetrahydrofolate reductase, partial [Chloroflexota bacterium]|nr:bifunctional homocysteine S-methyltransferase/methylenetetrahydrofolate reductase [Chloroflexota bacterium]
MPLQSPFRARLATARPVLFDGAMGTELYARGVSYERCFDELNLTEPELVQSVHRAYIAAGAEAIETNTFAANRLQLAPFGLEGRVRELNLRGVRLAREAKEVSGEDVFLAGSVSSLGQPLAPAGTITPEQARAIFTEQIEALLEGGVDLLVLETFADVGELRQAILAARAVTADLPIVAEVTVAEDGNTLSGARPEDVAAEIGALGVDALGVNCGVGPQATLEALQRMAPHTTLPLAAMPNAGYPAMVGRRRFYVSSPAYFAEYAGRFVQAGVRLIGGCCGTTPAHIAAMREALSQLAPAPPAPAVTVTVASPVHAPAPDVPEEQPEGAERTRTTSTLARKLRAARFPISVEVDPPRGLSPSKMLQGAALLKEAGADCVDIGDSPMARVRMSSIAFAALCEAEVGLETMIHYTTRDRNLMALQSDLLGAHALGIRNVIALTGDPPRSGSFPNATAVWDVDSIGLIKIIKQLNQGLDWAGNAIGRRTRFLVACAVSPMADDLELELERYWQKVEAGADFAITQPLYDLAQLHRFLDRVGKPPIPTMV